MELRRAAVVGGGLAGLTAAHRLSTSGLEVTVVEASSFWGGQVRTLRQPGGGGTLIELGAEGFSAKGLEVLALCEELDLTSRVLNQSVSRTLGFDGTQLSELAEGEAGIVAGIQSNPESFGAGLLTLKNGLGELAERLLERIKDCGKGQLLNGTRVDQVAQEGHRWKVKWGGEGERGQGAEVDAVVLAVPARETARLLEPFLDRAAGLDTLDLQSSVTVSQVYPRSAVGHTLDATGFVVTSATDSRGLRACTFCSSKFALRSAEGSCLLRAFFRPEGPKEIEASDLVWSEKATSVLAPILDVDGPARESWISRWPDALPRYGEGFVAEIGELRASLQNAGLEGLELAGVAVERGGVVAAVRSGQRAADRILDRSAN